MTTIVVNGARLGYEDAGAGPVVVFSHAGIADRRMWEHQFQHLRADYRVIRYDARGYGDSDDPAGDITPYRDLLGLLDALGVAQATLVGCSIGGSYALEVALSAPERVSALVLICAGLAGHKPPESALTQLREQVEEVVPAERLAAYQQRRGVPVRDEDVTAVAKAHARFMVAGPARDPAALDPQVWQAAVGMLEGVFARIWRAPQSTEISLEPPPADRLTEVRVPTLVVNGLADVPAIQEVSDLLAAGIPDAERVDLADTGHLPPLERPSEVTDLLRRFLAAAVTR